MTSFGGQASWAKITSFGGRPTVLVCHPTKKVNKAEEFTFGSGLMNQCLCLSGVLVLGHLVMVGFYQGDISPMGHFVNVMFCHSHIYQ